MPLPLPPVTLTPGVAQPIGLQNLGSIQAIKLSNGSPFDVTYSGFGVIGGEILPAGVENILYADVYNSGVLNLLPVNNSGSSGVNGIANLVVYQQGERLPSQGAAPGHWPVTIPVQIVQAKTSAVQTLSNEGATAGTLVIDIGPTGSNQAIAIYNDHFIWSVVQSGVAHQVLKGSTSGNPLQIGQSGDISEVLGNLTIDGTSIYTGDATFNGAGTGVAVTNNETIGGTLVVTGDVTLNGTGTGLAVAHNETVGGTLGVTGATTLSGGLTSSGGAQSITGNGVGSLSLGQSSAGDTINTFFGGTVQISPIALSGGSLILKDSSTATQILITNSGVSFKTIGTIAAGYQMIGDTTIANAGTSVAHSLGIVPTVVLPVHDTGVANADIININYGTMTSTHFTAYSTNAGGSGNVRFFVMG